MASQATTASNSRHQAQADSGNRQHHLLQSLRHGPSSRELRSGAHREAPVDRRAPGGKRLPSARIWLPSALNHPPTTDPGEQITGQATPPRLVERVHSIDHASKAMQA